MRHATQLFYSCSLVALLPPLKPSQYRLEYRYNERPSRAPRTC